MSEHQAKKMKPRTKGEPVVNQDTGRTVYVLPDTLKDNPDKFQKLPPEKAGDPRWRGKPKPPRKPRKPDKPDVPRNPPPTSIEPRRDKKPIDPTKPVTEVSPVKQMKDPEPSPKRKWKWIKRLQPSKSAAERVADRYLTRLASEEID